LKQVAQLEAGEPLDNNRELDPIREEFFEIFRLFQIRRKDASDLKKEQQLDHLKQKRTLLTRLEKVVKEEENIGAAFTAFNEIHEAWKTTGDIPRDKRDEVQSEYSRLREIFFYQVKIYRELKDHDLHRNQQLKSDIVSKIQNLAALTSMKEIETQLKALQNEWDEIGPVTDGEWESLKEGYWTNVKAIYDKINEHYDQRRKVLTANIDAKKAVIEEAKTLVENSQELASVKEWEAQTKILLTLQEKWKKIGFGSKKENEEVWQEFRGICDQFFSKKKEYFESLREESKDFITAKQKLIDKAIALQGSTDWKETAAQLIRLQKEWKTIGHAGQRMEQKLWKDFRSASDVFFNNRQAHFEEKDKENETNLAAKIAIIDSLKAYQPGEDRKQVLADLKDFAAKFNEIGHVPMKQKDEVYQNFKTALDSHYSHLKLEGQEKETILFQAKIDTLKASPDAAKLIDREKFEIRKQIDRLKQEIMQYENNLGFFGRSKGADAMKKEVESKIKIHENKIEEFKRKLKAL
ncbi:MAG: DUF349 domain-containing protein, partial [Bacteroidetes bacterium]|nr:DUF349 domain-containing protein [Bacteroidota bacterium]